MNLKVSDIADQISVYIGNAISLHNSLLNQSIEFSLLTNCKEIVEDAILRRGCHINVIKIPFITKVPSGARFYSAHFKIDAFRYLSTLSEEYVSLCDLDVLCINPPPLGLSNVIKSCTPVVYDISEQVIPVFGQKILAKDLSLLTGHQSEGRWYGGEFIAGPPSFFSSLVTQVEKIWPNYIDNINKLHHVGDEAVVSAAIDVMRSQGAIFCDGGTLGVVTRYWSSAVLHHQKPFSYFRKVFLLHAPSDKRFLNRIASMGVISSHKLVSIYTKHLVMTLPRRVVGKALKFIMRRAH